MISLVTIVLAMPQSLAGGAPALTESFEAPGTTWSATIFPDEFLLGAALSREPLSVGLGAPNTSPALPINAGGDLEGRYYETGLAATGGYALTADVPSNQLTDVALRGYVAIGNPDPFGSQSISFLLRANVTPRPIGPPRLNAYTATINRNGPGFATLSLARWNDGVIAAGDVFVSGGFPVDFANENYLLEFRVQSTILLARLWRVTADQGQIRVDPIVLGQGTGLMTNWLWARDGELTQGRAGVRGFARGGNSVFWDDLRLGSASDRLRFLAEPPQPPTVPTQP